MGRLLLKRDWLLRCVTMVIGITTLCGSGRAETGYIKYEPGTLNMILTAPHGGSLRPMDIRVRDAGCWNPANQSCVYVHHCTGIGLNEDWSRCRVVVGTDRNTMTLTRLLAEGVYNLTGSRPHVVINTLHRSRLDANRNRDVAAFDDPIAVSAWEEWQGYIRQAKAVIGGAAVLYDIHAHIHEEGLVELGYLISGDDLDRNEFQANDSSIRYLASRTNSTFEELLRGVNSLGTFLSAEGYDTVPSVRMPGPRGALYWYASTPGTNTMLHGSRDGGEVDAIQIETPEALYLDVDDVTITERYAAALARAIVRFHELYYSESAGIGQGAGMGPAQQRPLQAPDVCSRPNSRLVLGEFYFRLLCFQSVRRTQTTRSQVNNVPFRFNQINV